MSMQDTSREESKEISSGNREPHHIWEHTKESITQELFSLQNTKRMFRGNKWTVRYARIRKIFEEQFTVKEQAEIEYKVKKMLTVKGRNVYIYTSRSNKKDVMLVTIIGIFLLVGGSTA